ncbi:hypothetical protein AGR3A_Cc260175 [Agrobacterium tomkonis CFBP 6623]|uniref:Uncharacterized protein n=1 Tax=Agrobacterium tomkonis CFBP 6623 TaxID=1183432 RepID=A0A1S7PK82_9HYPH|nr:hypothetical protein AGR3A_Cc260175 [Agrobacterium tomkonis CFBP 6623]
MEGSREAPQIRQSFFRRDPALHPSSAIDAWPLTAWSHNTGLLGKPVSQSDKLFGIRRSANDVITARGTDSDIVSRPTPRFRRCGGPEHHGAFEIRNTSP